MDLGLMEWQPPKPEETRLVRVAIEGKKYIENMRDELRAKSTNSKGEVK